VCAEKKLGACWNNYGIHTNFREEIFSRILLKFAKYLESIIVVSENKSSATFSKCLILGN